MSTRDITIQYAAEISTGDVMVGIGAIDLYWERRGSVCQCRSALGALW